MVTASGVEIQKQLSCECVAQGLRIMESNFGGLLGNIPDTVERLNHILGIVGSAASRCRCATITDL